MREISKRTGIAFLFIILAALYFRDVLSGDYLLLERDLGLFFIPPRIFWVDAVKQGAFPFWNPYYLNGHPLFATLQAGVLYPFSVFYLFLPFTVVFNNTIVLHFALAGIFTYLLMRAQKASHEAAFISGICFVFGGYLMSVHNLLSTLLSVVWVPLFLLVYFAGFYKNANIAEVQGVPSKLKINMSIWAGVVGTMMFLGGGVEVPYLIFSLVFFLTLFPALLFEESQYPPIKSRLVCFAVFALTFGGLSAVQLLPFEELSRLSVRAKGLPYTQATTWSICPEDLITFFIPDLYGYQGKLEKYWVNQNWLKSIYLGSMPFLLSLFFFLRRERKPQGFLLLILLSLVLAFGGYTLFYPFIYKYVPLFNQLRYPAKFIFLAIFLISLSAGFGYDRFRDGQGKDWIIRLTKGIFCLGFAAIVLFGLLDTYEEPIISFCKKAGWDAPNYNDIHINVFNTKRFLFFTGFFSLLLFLWGQARSGKKIYAYAVILVLTLDLFFSNHGFYLQGKPETILKAGSNMSYILSDPSLPRVFVTQKTEREQEAMILLKDKDNFTIYREKVDSGLGLIQKIFEAGSGAEVTTQSRYSQLITLINSSPAPDSTHLLDMLGVKYVVSIPVIKSPNYKLVNMSLPMEGSIEELEKQKTIKVYENRNVLPRAFLVGACRVVHSEEEYKTTLSSSEFHPERLVLLDAAPTGFLCDESALPSPASDSVYVTDYQNNFVELQAKLKSKKFLFLSDSYFPGWKALVDGMPTTIYRADYIFRAILLEPGEHRIRFQYNPLSFKIGASITFVTLALCGVLLTRRKP